jgi:hypothetical protein
LFLLANPTDMDDIINNNNNNFMTVVVDASIYSGLATI